MQFFFCVAYYIFLNIYYNIILYLTETVHEWALEGMVHSEHWAEYMWSAVRGAELWCWTAELVGQLAWMLCSFTPDIYAALGYLCFKSVKVKHSVDIYMKHTRISSGNQIINNITENYSLKPYVMVLSWQNRYYSLLGNQIRFWLFIKRQNLQIEPQRGE